MPEPLFLAADLGTSYIKVGVYDLHGHCLSGSQTPVSAGREGPGVFRQSGDMLYACMCACLKKAVQALGGLAADIRAIAFTGQMAGAIGVDENWTDITSWSCSLDSRYLPYADRQRAAFGSDIFSIGGTNAPVLCAKYAWFQDAFPEEHRRIAKYVMLNGYMIGRLAELPIEEAKIDHSLIGWTGLSDIRSRSWSETLCREMGVSPSHLPQIVSGTSIGGYLSENAAKLLGLKSGLPLVMGTGDKIAGCVGAGALTPGMLVFEGASYGAVSLCVSDVRMDTSRKNYDVIGGIDDRNLYAHKYIQGSGIATDWFVEQFVQERNMSRQEAFQYVEQLAAPLPPGSGNMLAIGLLGGSAMPFDSELRGLFMGHSWAHRKEHFYHALLESFSYDLALTLESLFRQYPPEDDIPIRMIGGGASSAVWPQMLADVTGRSFALLDRTDNALWGTALLAAAGEGSVPDICAAADSHVQIRKEIAPDPKRHPIYQQYIRMYESVTKELHGFYARLNALP